MIVLGDAREGKCSSLLYRGIKFFKTVNEGIECTRVNNCLCKVRRVFGNRSEHICGGFLVETLN